MSSGALIAIDPGAVSGACAVRFHDGETWVGDLAVVNGQLDAAALSRMTKDMRVATAVVEQVGAMPKQGVASTWKFGFACGVINGVLISNGVPVHYVTPPVWKRHHVQVVRTYTPRLDGRGSATTVFDDGVVSEEDTADPF